MCRILHQHAPEGAVGRRGQRASSSRHDGAQNQPRWAGGSEQGRRHQAHAMPRAALVHDTQQQKVACGTDDMCATRGPQVLAILCKEAILLQPGNSFVGGVLCSARAAATEGRAPRRADASVSHACGRRNDTSTNTTSRDATCATLTESAACLGLPAAPALFFTRPVAAATRC